MEPGCVWAQEMRTVVISTMKGINVYQHVIKLELTSLVQVCIYWELLRYMFDEVSCAKIVFGLCEAFELMDCRASPKPS